MKRLFLTGCLLGAGLMSVSGMNPVVANPINLNYQFGLKSECEEARREAADPVIELWNDVYYLFASKSSGYWRSTDLAHWDYIPAPSIETINDYAPTVCEIDGEYYFMASDVNRIFKTKTPDDGMSWVEVDCKFPYGQHDPCIWQDDDGRVYLYWGCHDKEPIYGVEVDVANGFAPKGERVVLIEHNIDKYGWEVPGVNNEETHHNGWNEGPAMLKHNGKYYLQYAAPGTQWRIYGDGLYVGDSPLGPFTAMEGNPFSLKPGGFIGGAGHGHTFRDRYGNIWHVATMKISMRHWFERRLGLFPVVLDEKNNTMRTITEGTDYPFEIPQRAFDAGEKNLSLGYKRLGGAVSASSSLAGHAAENAFDEEIETWWSAQSGRKGEWLEADLGMPCMIHAIQPNFADEGMSVYRPYDFPMVYNYIVEASVDGSSWRTIVDRSNNVSADMPHELIVMDKPVKARYVRIVNNKDIDGKFSLYDLRLFGKDGHKPLGKVASHNVKRDSADPRHITLDWTPVDGAERYVVRWGIAGSGVLGNSVEMKGDDTSLDARWYNRDSEYDFEVCAY